MQKKIIIFLVSLLFIAFAGFFSLPMLINKDAIKNQVVASFKLTTGLDLQIQGKLDLEAFPLPHMIMHDLYVPNIPTASTPFLLTIKTINVRPVFSSLFGGTLAIGKLSATGVNVELERFKSGGVNWHDSSLQTPANGLNAKSADAVLNASSIVISNAELHYTDSIANTVSDYKNINLELNNRSTEEDSLALNFTYKDRPFSITGSVGDIGKALREDSVPAHLTIVSKGSRFTYEGNVGYKNAQYTLKGNSSLATDDLAPLIRLMSNAPDAPSATAGKPLSFQAKTDIDVVGEKVTLSNMTLDSGMVKGNAQAVITLPYKADVRANITTLDLEALLGSGLFGNGEKTPEPAPADQNIPVNDASAKTLWNLITLAADINVADMTYNQQHIQNTHFNFDMESGEINIPQATALLPGESRMVFTGIGREGFQGVTLEGQIDASGANFAEMVKVFKPKGFAIPAEDFKRFRIKTNAVVSSKEARFSELAARIENMGFVGGIVATFGDRTKLKGALRIGGLNLDHVIALWGLKEWEASFLADTVNSNKEELLSYWLKQLGFDLEMNTSIEQYVLDGKLAQKTDLDIIATPGVIKIPEFKTFYNGSTLMGSILLDVNGALPRMDMDVTADVLDTAAFFGHEAPLSSVERRAQPGEFWSHKGFDLHLLEYLNSNYHFKIGRFNDEAFEATQLEMRGNITNRTLTMDAFSGETLGAKFDGKAVVVGGRIPGLSLAADIQDLNAARLSSFLPVLSGMAGKYNLNMRFETSGIDMYTWISNLNGSIGMAGRDIIVRGFNLPGIVKAVNYVRTVANILDVVQRAFPGGDTVFSKVEGRWAIANGIATASNMKFSNPDSIVSLGGQVDLVNWKINGKFSFPLISLDATNPPSMLLNMTGNLDAPEKSLDTHMLEQYVTNKTSEKILRQYDH